MMTFVSVSLLAIAISVVNGKIDLQKDRKLKYEPSPPWFCHGLDCPEYKTLKTTDDYEIRQYKESMWVSTRITGMDYDEAVSEGFRKLFDYIEGDNVEKKKVPMTAPVITRVMPGDGSACKSDFTISFFVAQPNPPTPTAKDVMITKLPEQKAYVRSFPGYADQDKWLQEAAELADALVDATSPYHTDYFYTAGYDAPFRPFNRHNEVWFIFDE